MAQVTVVCARCASDNLETNRFCEACGLPLGTASPDTSLDLDVIAPQEALDAAEPHLGGALREFVEATGLDASRSGPAWRVVVPVAGARKQAVFIGASGTDDEDQPVVSLVSVCGPANERDLRPLLKINARAGEGSFAIRVLRGEEYFVVVRNLAAGQLDPADAPRLVRRIAEAADRLEDRLSRGRDLY
jgi:hypothetical protein